MGHWSAGKVLWLVLAVSCLIVALVFLAIAVVVISAVPPIQWTRTLVYVNDTGPGASRNITVTYPDPLKAEEIMKILPGNPTYKQFDNPDVPLYKDVYFYNLTNPEEFVNGSRPQVEELGPYSYREYRRKFFDESSLLDNDTLLEYTQLRTFHFSPQTSANGATEDDIICTINLPYTGAVAQVLSISDESFRNAAIGFMNDLFQRYSESSKLYICIPASQLVFNYTDPLVQELHTNSTLRNLDFNLDESYISIQNNATGEDLPNLIYTGVGDITKIATLYEWYNQTDLGDLWPGATANEINGTEGLIFHPNLKEGESLTVFVEDTLRSFPLNYTGKQTIMGIETYRYMLPSSVFESAFTNPENARWGSWCPDGLIYLGVLLKPNIPIFGSKPRFLDCDPEETRDKIDGIPEPVPAKDDLFVYINPLTGANVHFDINIQINMQINYTDQFPYLDQINGTMYFPIMYIDEHSVLTEEFRNYLLDVLKSINVNVTISTVDNNTNGTNVTTSELIQETPLAVYIVFPILLVLSIITVILSLLAFVRVYIIHRKQGGRDFTMRYKGY